MKDKTYNGWSNYATWKINLEFGLDDGGFEEYNEETLKEYVEECLAQNCGNEKTLTYALDFTDDVNWNEIYTSIIEYAETY